MLLELSDELVVATLALLPTVDVGRAALSCRRLAALSREPLAHSSVQIRPDALQDYGCLFRLAAHTTEVRVKSKEGVANRHRFCRYAVLPFRHPFESACGSLLDAGASALLDACGHSLLRLHLPGMCHLTKASLIAVLRACPSLVELNVRGCERIMTGVCTAAALNPLLVPRPALRVADLSHTHASDLDLGALLRFLPHLHTLRVNFCAALSDEVLDMLPSSLARVEALGCERFSFRRLEQLGKELANASEDDGEGASSDAYDGCLRCDDSIVLGALGRGGADKRHPVSQSLFAMLFEYRAEEANRGEASSAPPAVPPPTVRRRM